MTNELAIKILTGDVLGTAEQTQEAVTMAVKALSQPEQEHLEQMPSVQPERIRGRWEIYVISMLAGEGYKCSECGFEGVPYWDFCPNCGADMRETDGSED